jgi:hypothetical protein
VTIEPEFIKLTLLSIDAWRYDNSWQWNQWHTLEKGIYFSEDSLTPRKVLAFLRKADYLTSASKGKLAIDDDGYNIVIELKDTHEPILALCYGEHL